MSAERLRKAAAAIRKDQDVEEQLGHIHQREYETWLAVASWLDACATVLEVSPHRSRTLALNVARAYLGDDV